jgi:hypothetical protein
MMTLSTIVSQPVWILVTLIGVADILILLWCIALIRRNRKLNDREDNRDEFAAYPGQPMFNCQFQQSLIGLQIDAVFDGLAALIETERMKLKSMISPVAAPIRAETVSVHEPLQGTHDFMEGVSRPPVHEEPPLDQQIARIADSGMKPAAISARLGISLAEVNLALRMRTSAKTAAGCKLEAVA